MIDTIKAKGPWWELAPYIRGREPFRTHGALYGRTVGHYLDHGRLPKEWSEVLDADMETGVEYVVYSYNTPIAWYSTAFGWRVPDVKYSVTTQQHQSRVRTAIFA